MTSEETDEAVALSLLGEGFHTALRKASDHPSAWQAWKAVEGMPPEEWDAILRFVLGGLRVNGVRLFTVEEQQ